jgi:hypothetical protein
MVKFYRLLLVTWLCAGGLGCANDKKPGTELMLVADTDISDLDTIRFEVSDSEANKSEQAAPRADGEPLTLGVVLEKSSLGPVTVSAIGIRGGRTVVERNAVVSFVPGKTLVVELHLLASCESKRCLTNQTCTEYGCSSNQLGADQLSEWTGSAPSLGDTLLTDAGRTDASGINGDAGSTSDGGSEADGASGLTTCGLETGIDLTSDVNHCGDCKTVCKSSGRNLVAVCVASECTEECRLLYGDCDGNASNGCEQSLIVSTHCGMCGMRCATGTSCQLGTCR